MRKPHTYAKSPRVAEQFDWTHNAKEVAPTLYQNVITQEERKKLGEYYTPRWLAREITETVVDNPLNQRVIDPSCGSLAHIVEFSCIDREGNILVDPLHLHVGPEGAAGLQGLVASWPTWWRGPGGHWPPGRSRRPRKGPEA